MKCPEIIYDSKLMHMRRCGVEITNDTICEHVKEVSFQNGIVARVVFKTKDETYGTRKSSYYGAAGDY